MNVNRGGAFNDESFASARASALKVFRTIYGPTTEEFQEFSEGLKFDLALSDSASLGELHSRFLETAVAAIRPQDKAT